jgi:hypothetical protein
MAPSTLEDYREILDRIFRPEIGRKAQSLTWSPPGRYPFSCAKNEKARQLAGFRVFWLGWQDSNLRMAGSKPAVIASIINKLLTILTEIFPYSPFDSFHPWNPALPNFAKGATIQG